MEGKGIHDRVAPETVSTLLSDLARLGEGGMGSGWGDALRPGAVIGRFELVRELGRGGSGIVYEAKDRDLGREVALKAIRTGALRMDSRKARAAARLQHPNIAALLEVGSRELGAYLIFELLRGRTLAERLRQGALPIAEAARIALEASTGLAYAHDHGVVHRGLTPENVFLCEDGHVKLLGVGLGHASPRQVAGRARAYLAPEQRSGRPGDERSDVFALGVVLFEMLSGELPFLDDGGEAKTARRLVLDPPGSSRPAAPLGRILRLALGRRWARSAPHDVGRLVERMLQRRPARRPGSAGELLAALTAFERYVESAAPSIAIAAEPSSPECKACRGALEEIAFRGEQPAGTVRAHLASCKACAKRWKRERALYAVPPELEERAVKSAARASKVQKLVAAGDLHGAVDEVMRDLGPKIFGLQRAVMRGDEAKAAQAFEAFAERLWKEKDFLPRQPSLRAWTYRLAWNAILSVLERENVLDALTPEERSLLTLRMDQGFSWGEISEIHGAPDPGLQMKFERIKERLALG